ncbi:MAG: hypothetical protein N4A62_18205 [Marinisporobacter sp.]|jgi:hypothetical protein|nr:hypothetical protein [Marinisporobacter sp.]
MCFCGARKDIDRYTLEKRIKLEINNTDLTSDILKMELEGEINLFMKNFGN